MDPSTTNVLERVHVMKNQEKKKHPKLSELEGSAMTLSGDEDSLVTEATHNLLEFAMTKGHTIHTVTQMSKLQLADFLRDFYGKVKLKNDESLTLKDLRAGLHKFFLVESNVDILNDRSFELANTTFDLALKANRRSCHRMRIEMEDLRKIYLSDAMDTNNPESLQNKVFFDISLYICNKGKDYFRNMKKTDFDVVTDGLGRRSVLLKNTSIIRDEDYPLKLKRGAENDPPSYQVGERMYERPGDPRCPLSSFLKYITHLHPMTDAFWQRPKRGVSQSDYVWYDHAPLGSSTLTKIMQRISTQAGLSDNYTNYSIRTACIPLVETVCEEALRMENGEGGGFNSPSQTQSNTPINVVKPSQPPMSHSISEDMSSASDDCMSQTSELRGGGKDNMPDTNGGGPRNLSKKAPSLQSTDSGGSLDMDDSDLCDLMHAKSQVLSLIRGLKVNDIQKFVDWLKTIRIQYNSGELIVLCSPVEKSKVEPIPDDVQVDRNGFASRTATPTSMSDPHLKKSASLDLPDKRHRLRKESSIKGDNPLDYKISSSTDLMESSATTIKQVEFDHVAGVHCSTSEMGPMKITVPNQDSVLLTGIPENLQLMLHKKDTTLSSPSNLSRRQEPLASRIFSSENELDVAEVVAMMTSSSAKMKQLMNGGVGISSSSSINSSNNNSNNIHIIHNNNNSINFQSREAQVSPGKHTYNHIPSHNGGANNLYPKSHPHHPSIHIHPHPQQQPQSMTTLTVPAAHNPVMSSLSARDHFREYRNRSMGYLNEPNPALAEGNALKRTSSTGTPVLKRQAHVDSGMMHPENLSVKKLCEEPIQATNLSLKPTLKKSESAEDKKARADRLTDSLRYHQEILKNSPLIKRPGERNFSGFRHCYANKVASGVKAEPQDTSYS